MMIMWIIFFYLVGLIVAWALGELWIKKLQKKLMKQYNPEEDLSRKKGHGRFED